MSRRVLIGISQSSGPFVGSLMQSSMQLAVPEAEEIIVAYNLDEFMDYLSLGEFDTIVCLEFIGMDYGYADYLLESGIEDKLCLFILPDQQKGDSTLKKYVDAGFNRFLFQKDMNNGSIKGMLKDGYDTAEDTLEYLGLYFRPMKVESPDVEKDSTVAGTQITRKYLGNGVAVTTLCGGDVRKLHITSADEDPVLSGLRLRMCIWKHWKNPITRERNLVKLGIDRETAHKVANCSRAYAKVCSCGAVNMAITNKRLTSFGLVSMLDYYTERCVTC